MTQKVYPAHLKKDLEPGRYEAEVHLYGSSTMRLINSPRTCIIWTKGNQAKLVANFLGI